jgi:hypothetical protein
MQVSQVGQALGEKPSTVIDLSGIKYLAYAWLTVHVFRTAAFNTVPSKTYVSRIWFR